MRLRFILCILVLLLSSGCYRMTYKFTLDQGNTHRYSFWNHYFFYGFAAVKERYQFGDLCPAGAVTRVDSRIDGANALASLLSLGTNGAATISVQCLVKTEAKK